MFSYSRGSNWTDWDLHIHTPATLLASSFKGAGGDEVWTEFCETVAKSNLHVIGVTNYFCLDGFDRVVDAFNQGALGSVKCVLPNIEFRIDQKNKDGSHIHVHVVFADRFTQDTSPIQRFLDNLTLIMTTANGKVERCTREAVSRLGPDKLLIPLKELDSKLKESFTRLEDYVFIAGCRGLGNFRPGANDSRGDTLAIEIDKMCDVIYGSTDADRMFFLNNTRYDGALQKPVFICSDAHSIDEVGSRRTWVRANPTYEGLKQAVFEPNLRVSLNKPISEKSLYSVLHSIRFQSPTLKSTMFQEHEIMLNSDLTVLIGGKSTGKSLFLHYLARTIDDHQVLDREAVVLGQGVSHYNFEEHTGFDVEVKWSDGCVQTFSNRQSEEVSRKVIYIPQRFLNEVCELQVPAGGRTLDSFTREALRQRDTLSNAFDSLDSANAIYERDVRESLDKMFEHYDKYHEVYQQLKELGDEQGVLAEIERLDDQIEECRKTSDLTQEQSDLFDSLSQQLEEVSVSLDQLQSDKDTIIDGDESIKRAIARLSDVLSEMLDSIEHPELRKAASDEFCKLKDVPSLIDPMFSLIREKRKSLADALHKKQQKIEINLKPIADTIQHQKELERLSVKKREQKQRLSVVQTLTKRKIVHNTAIFDEITKLKDYTDRIISVYQNTTEVLSKEGDALGDISFDAKIVYDETDMNSHFVNTSVKTHSLKALLEKTGTYEFEFDISTHAGFVTDVARGIMTGKVTLMKGISLRQALEALCKHRLMFDYQIQYQGDRIEAMSPGKRALVVLKILLELSNDEAPILLDQPDDDLDSRSVYRELVHYFKSKKKTRQVVLVTHNPNLVVGSDADEVIVANQSGQETGRENSEATFEYVSGALECTFNDSSAKGILNKQGIREHVCEILEGGSEAFLERERKYRLGYVH